MIILSALGTGTYQEASYRFSRREQIVTTGFFAEALAQWYPDATLLILETPGAKSKHGEAVRLRIPHAQFLSILAKENELGEMAEDFSEESYWAMFQTVVDAIHEGEEVIFDITHSFRSLPMLGFLMLAYLRVAKNVTLRRVLYGAWEAKGEQGITPVFDLTPFVTMLDWAQAANRFKDTGDASLFTPLLQEKRIAAFNSVSRQLTCLSEALNANRGLRIGAEAAKLQKVIRFAEEQGGLESHQRPFSLILERLKEQTAKLAHDEAPVLTLQAQHAQIHWYAERGHFPQAMALAREWLISVRQWHEHGLVTMDQTEREQINGDCNLVGDRAALEALPAHLQQFAQVHRAVNSLRNDLMHFGFNSHPAQAGQLKNNTLNLLAQLPAAVLPLGLDLNWDSV